MTADKKVVEGKLKWVLLERIGKPRIVDSTEIKPKRSSLCSSRRLKIEIVLL